MDFPSNNHRIHIPTITKLCLQSVQQVANAITTLGGIKGTLPMDDGKEFASRDEPPRRHRVVQIRRVGPTDRLSLICLSEKFQGFDFHWDPVIKRTRPCYLGKDLCPWHLMNLPLKWYGFLHCFDVISDAQCFIQVTDVAAQDFLARTKDYASFRGLKINVCREGGRIRSPLIITVENALWVHKEWPKVQDVRPTLRSVFGE